MAGRPSCHDAQVDTTFTRDEARGEGGEVKETSWTTGLRIFAPNGDLVDVSLPGTRPNTSRVAGAQGRAGRGGAMRDGSWSLCEACMGGSMHGLHAGSAWGL